MLLPCYGKFSFCSNCGACGGYGDGGGISVQSCIDEAVFAVLLLYTDNNCAVK